MGETARALGDGTRSIRGHLPDVASRSFRRRGEVGRTISGAKGPHLAVGYRLLVMRFAQAAVGDGFGGGKGA
jgi:hypothetical protein